MSTSGHRDGDPRTPADQDSGSDGIPAEPAHSADVAQDTSAGDPVAALREVEDRFLRLAAEYDNYRKRTTREKAESFDRGAAAFAKHLFSTLDDLDRLLAADTTTGSVGQFREGLELIVRKMFKELETGGLEAIDPVGQRFDPAEHDAVSLATPDDPALDDTVSATLQKGYRFRGAVIRAAKVQVYTVDGAI